MERKMLLIFVVVSILALDVTRADNHPSCFSDLDTCAQSMKDLMMSDTAFWFGTDFASRGCTPGSFTRTECFNPDPVNLSILRRLYNATGDSGKQKIDAATSTMKVAHVDFPKKDGTYYGCGHYYKAPGNGFRLDPLKVTTVDSWTLDHMPRIKWDAQDGALYTIAVWDVGYYFMHGLLVNAQGGNTDNGYIPVDEYHGPINPFTSPNIFLFAVFKQSGYIDPGMAGGILGKLIGMYQAAVPMAALIQDMNGMIGDLVAANVLSVPGDAYSMERQKNTYILNNCPLLISQTPPIKDVLMTAGLAKTGWSNIKQTLDFTPTPHLSTLTTELSVEYFNDRDITVDSCCVKTTFPQSLFRPDPLGTTPTKPAVTRSTPRVHISPINIMTDQYNGVRTKTYTLLMVDMSDPTNYIIHWMVSDIHDADVAKGNEILPYLGPNPFTDNGPRTYVFLLLNQNDDKLDVSDLGDYTSDSCPSFIANRCRAQLSLMMERKNLDTIVGMTWFQAVQDAYARKRLYQDLMVKRMIDVCDGQPGFEDPCPKEQYCASTSTNTATGSKPAISVLFAAFVSTLAALVCRHV